MTGYGKAVVAYGDKKINVEVKSLNSKTLDLTVRICPLYREKELELRQTISKVLERGKVDFSLWIEREVAAEALPINAELMKNYYTQIVNIVSTTGIPEPQDIFSTLLKLPDVMTKTDVEVLTDEEWSTASEAVNIALGQLAQRRLVAHQHHVVMKLENGGGAVGIDGAAEGVVHRIGLVRAAGDQ